MEAKKLLMVFGIITLIFGLWMWSTNSGTATTITSPHIIVTLTGAIEIVAGWKVKK